MDDEARKRLEKNLEIALDNRKFEIELLWKRNAAFWLFIAAIAAATGIASKEDHFQLLAIALSVTGALLSFVWFLVNRSGKAWQTSWEAKAEHYMVERYGEGNLFIRWAESDHPCRRPVRYSVSGLLLALSLFVTFFWVGLTVYLVRSSLMRFDRHGIIATASAHPIGIFLSLSILYCLFLVKHWRRKDPYFIVVHDKQVCDECSQPWSKVTRKEMHS